MKKQDASQLITKEDLSFVRRLFLKNIFWLVLIPIVFFLIGWIYSYKQVEEFGASAQVLLKTGETNDFEKQVNRGVGYASMYSDITNQTRLVQSYDLVGEVIDDLDFDVSYFIEGRLRTSEQYHTTPFTIDLVSVSDGNFNAVYESPIYLSIIDSKQVELKSNIGLNGVYEFGEDIPLNGGVIKVNKDFDFNDDRAKLMSETVYFIKVHSRKSLINKFKSRMTVNNIEGTTILTVNVKDQLSVKATLFLDSLIHKFSRNSMKNEFEIKAKTLFYINEQLNSTRSNMDTSQIKLQKFKDSASILNLEKEELNYFEQMVEYEGKLLAEKLKRNSIDSLRNYIQNLGSGKMLAPAYYLLVKDEYLTKQLAELYQKQYDLRAAMAVSTDKSTKVRTLNQQISDLKSNILIIINNNKAALNNEIKRLDKRFNFYKSKLAHIPVQSGSLIQLERERQVNEKLFNFLLEKKANTEIAQVGIVSKVNIIEEARPSGIVSKSKKQLNIYFLIAGVIVALIFAFIRTVWFIKFQDLQDLREYAKDNVLAGIPTVKLDGGSSLVMEFGPKSNVAESFRGLRTNIEYLATNEKSKIVLMSSIHPGEGKTFCSSNIATFLAASGKKVIIIDFDLHKPRLHERFNLKNTKGMSSFLSGKNSFKDVMVSIESQPNLDIVLAGPIPPNPSELILGGQVEDLLLELKKEYDYIIFDTPPVGLITDALALMKFAHINLFVMNTKFANKKGVDFLEEIMNKSDASSGLILNQIRQKKWKYYYKNYAYKYGYGYGYGYGEDS
jgi:capsular exopolysaccharide synthesis family protein